MNALDNNMHGLSGAYVVDALDPEERASFEEHLLGCQDCRDEVAELSETAVLMADLTPKAPPADLRNRVLAEIRTVRPLPPLQPSATVVPLASRRRRVLTGLASAAAVAALVGGGAVLSERPWQDAKPQVQLSSADQVLQAKDARRYTATIPGGAQATVTRSVSLGRAVIATHDMPSAPVGKVFELWLQLPSGDMRPAGLMAGGTDQTVVLDGDAAGARAAAITTEPAGGSQQPTQAPIMMFDFRADA